MYLFLSAFDNRGSHFTTALQDAHDGSLVFRAAVGILRAATTAHFSSEKAWRRVPVHS
jgi:hypothetical protein